MNISNNVSEKTASHISNIFVKTDDAGRLYLSVVSTFVKKKIANITRENAPKAIPKKETTEAILKTWEEVTDYPLRQISVHELMELRLSEAPGLIYKKNKSFFYSDSPYLLSLTGKMASLGKHACGEQCTMVCKGCPRTSDLTVAYQMRFGQKFPAAVKNSWRIEKYDFVLEGLEFFNLGQKDACIVLQCENYLSSPTASQKPDKNLGKLKASIASFYWGDFHGDRKDMISRLRANGLRGYYDPKKGS